jgi:hypothetical protein
MSSRTALLRTVGIPLACLLAGGANAERFTPASLRNVPMMGRSTPSPSSSGG